MLQIVGLLLMVKYPPGPPMMLGKHARILIVRNLILSDFADLIPNVYGSFATIWAAPGSGSERMVMKFAELVLVAALVVGLIMTMWAVLAMAALQ